MEPEDRIIVILFNPPPFGIAEAKLELCWGIPPIGCFLKPVGGNGIVLVNTKSFGIAETKSVFRFVFLLPGSLSKPPNGFGNILINTKPFGVKFP